MKYCIGQQVGDYVLIGYIGSGAAGHVYRVEHAVTRRVEAMKILVNDSPDSHRQAQRFLREAKIQAGLDHPNITTVLNAFWVGADLAIVMEYVKGESLRQIIDRGPVPLDAAYSYARQILSALAYAHQKGVIHRDVSPSNILVTDEGRVKLTDFGLAKEPGGLHLTQTGLMVGSLHYCSPEQIRSAPVDPRSDVYSAGAVLYELFSGRKVFDAPSAFELMLAHTEQKPVPPIELKPDLTASINRAILRALEKDPERRFPSAEGFLEAIEGRSGGRLSALRGWDQLRWATYAAGGFLVIAVSLGAVSLLADRMSPPAVPPPPFPASPIAKPVVEASHPASSQPVPQSEEPAQLAAESAAARPKPAPQETALTVRRRTPSVTPLKTSPITEPKAELTRHPSAVATITPPPAAEPLPIPAEPAPTEKKVEPMQEETAAAAPQAPKIREDEKKPKPGLLRSIGRRLWIFRRKSDDKALEKATQP